MRVHPVGACWVPGFSGATSKNSSDCHGNRRAGAAVVLPRRPRAPQGDRPAFLIQLGSESATGSPASRADSFGVAHRRSESRTMDVRSKLLAAIDASGLTDRKLSIRATGTPDTIRNLRRGACPRADTLERLCHVMGLEVEIVPAPVPPKHRGPVPALVGPTVFTGNREIPVHDWDHCSESSDEEGYVRRGEDSSRAPAPPGVADEQAFYVRMADNSMVPAEIRKDDYCLVSPLAAIEVDQRLWVETRTGREMIKWLLRLTPDGFDLGAWDPAEKRCPAPVASFLKREDVVDRGVVIAVLPRAASPVEDP